ncbi:hypothetical protein IFM89_026647 [Coptis chinensis]|uniref:Uncharacterized protein n=1 Tax=Coptis chinensis TaxID=261450 RepID=A0A835H7A9_9MAGN|nr:hypothetical protein IFM89_026647 [Coptis chinensis]
MCLRLCVGRVRASIPHVVNLFSECVNAPTMAEFQDKLAELKRIGGPKIEEFLVKIPFKHWANACFQGCRVVRSNEVEDVIVHHINVERRYCSCRYWQIDMMSYSHSIHPIANIEMPMEMPKDCDIMPPDVRRGPGRPKKKRIIESTGARRRRIQFIRSYCN